MTTADTPAGKSARDSAARHAPSATRPSQTLPLAVEPETTRAHQLAGEPGPQRVYRDDELYESAIEEKMAELFAQAVERLEEGESIPAILAGLPPETARELSGMLRISESLLAIQHASLPVRSATRVRARRAEFVDQIALEATRQKIAQPETKATSPTWAGHVQAGADANAAGLQRLGARMTLPIAPGGQPSARPAPPARSWLQRLGDLFFAGRMRMAPLALTLALAVTGALGLARVTQASLPGDLTYPIKSWVTMMNLSLAAPDARSEASVAAALQLQADIVASATRAQERATVDARITAPRESVSLLFDGYEGRLLKFGDVRVVPTFQPDPNLPATRPMEIVGELQPGALVLLTMQILPGQGDLVQGVRAEVREAAAPAPSESASPEEPAVTEPPTPEGAEMLVPALEEGATPVPCTPSMPEEWGVYTVVKGDNLTALARATGATVREIAGANCLWSDVIVIDQQIFLPLDEDLPVVAPAPPAADAAPEGEAPIAPAAKP